MLACLARRGPEGSAEWTSGSASLGVCLSASTPEAQWETAPLVDEKAGLVLAADARIDNREELIPLLVRDGRKAHEVGDGALILAAYERWGETCPEKLVGDFAFAIWDSKRQSLFCARDAVGARPLYYHGSGSLFVLASEIQPLFCLPEVPRRLNEARVADHLAFLVEDRQSTFYQEIYQLPAAHSLTASSNGLQVRRYWALDASREQRLPSDEAYREAFLEVFMQAVRDRLRSAAPVGALLSGGLDSSSIACIARDLLARDGGAPLHTFSAVFPTLAKTYPSIDERPWIEPIVAQGGLLPHFVEADTLDPLEALEISLDEPIPIPNLWLDWGCFNAARQAGVRVILSGYDGDTTISYGHGYLTELMIGLRWMTLHREARALAGRLKWPLRRVLKEYGTSFLIPPAVDRLWNKVRGREGPLLPFPTPIQPAFARRIGLVERARAQMDGPAFFKGARELHRQSLNSGFILFGPELLDKVGNATGVEGRMPFFDRRVLEFALALPTDQKLRGGWNRFILRSAMQGILPDEVQWRTSKGNLSPNIRRGLLEKNIAILEESILGDTSRIEPYVDVPALRAAYQRFCSRPMQSSDADIFTILVTVTLARWLRRSGLGA
jgi:asparagine synthase (glutamine-hydrolysing)